MIWHKKCNEFQIEATRMEGGDHACRHSFVVSLCLMQKVRKMFGGVRKSPYLCGVKMKINEQSTSSINN